VPDRAHATPRGGGVPAAFSRDRDDLNGDKRLRATRGSRNLQVL